jgi:hypothetical protein
MNPEKAIAALETEIENIEYWIDNKTPRDTALDSVAAVSGNPEGYVEALLSRRARFKEAIAELKGE